MCVCMYVTYIHTLCIYIYVCVCVCVCVYVYMYIYIYIYIYICMYVYVCVYKDILFSYAMRNLLHSVSICVVRAKVEINK